jgi:hypothetical protein
MENQDLELYSQNVLDQHKELFNRIKEISDDLVQNPDVQNIGRYYRHQDILTGIYGTLNVVYKQAKAYKTNKEAEYYNGLKLEANIQHRKFVATVAEKESSLYVAPLRMARNILEGYIEILVIAINTCRSRIWEHKNDKHYEG